VARVEGELPVMDTFERNRRFDNIRTQEAAGNVADSMDVRIAIVERIESGEITLEQGQRELAAIKRRAKATGKITRNQAFRGA
jgi:hypothetical protein